MNIGITYDLRDDYLRQGYTEEETAEFDAPETIDAIVGALETLGHSATRIGGIRSLTTLLSKGQSWDLVFNYAEGMFGMGREAQVPALLDAFQIPHTFSDALVMALTLHKGMTKHVVRDLGIPTAPFAVVQHASQLQDLRLPFPLFAKPVAGGTSVGISSTSRVESLKQLQQCFEDLSSRFRQPVLVETFLPGRELTVGIVGTGAKARAIGVMEILFGNNAEPFAYSYANKKYYEDRIQYRLVDDNDAAEAVRIALSVWGALGCRDLGRVDCRCDADGRVNFIEINPIAGLHPVHSDIVILSRLLGIPYVRIIEWIVTSARERLTQ